MSQEEYGEYLKSHPRRHFKDYNDNSKVYVDLNIGFYHQVFDQCKGTFETLKSVRKHYPDAPIYMVCDGETEFTNDLRLIAKKFNCHFVLEPRIGVHNISNLSSYEYLRRIKDACNYCKTDWMIILEDDVICYDKISKAPPAHIAGPSGPEIPPAK